MRLKDKVAIVTGGARGLGKAYAMRLSEEGARVAVTDILDPSQVKAEIEGRGGEAIALYADVSDEKSVDEAVRKTLERFGKIDILVNNAGIFADINIKPFHEIPLAEWDKIIRVNLTGIFLCCKAVYPQMKKQGKGKIINISSSVFYSGVPYFLHYVTSKGAIIALTRALAREVGDDNISVNSIAPGFTMSEAVEGNPKFSEQAREIAIASRCFKRAQRSEDLLGTLVLLASDESDFITGQTIVVDGGMVLN